MGKDPTDPGIESFNLTRSCAAILAADPDWVVRLGYGSYRYILGCSRFAPLALSSDWLNIAFRQVVSQTVWFCLAEDEKSVELL